MKETSKYDAEFSGLSEYALLGRIRTLISGYRFTAGRYGRRAAQKAVALEEMLYREQETMVDGRDEALMQSDASGTGPHFDSGIMVRPRPQSSETGLKTHSTRSMCQKSGTGRYEQLRMVF